MKICRNCSREIKEAAAFCPYCGQKCDDDNTPESATGEDIKLVKKIKVSKKSVTIIVAAVLSVFLVVYVAICEMNITKAKELYALNEYFQAYETVRYVPSLGRESLIRIKIAWRAGDYYESYLSTKQIRLKDASRTDKYKKEAFQDAFFDLVFGLHLDERDVKSPNLNEIEISEYKKFIGLFKNELKEVFYASESEINRLLEAFEGAEVKDMNTIANEWLDKNFFLF